MWHRCAVKNGMLKPRKLHVYGKNKNPQNLIWNYKQYDDEDHISCFFIGLYNALRDLYSPFKISEQLITSADIKGIEKHYTELTARYNYSIIPDWKWLNWVANWHFLMNRTKEAIGIYRLTVKYYPELSEAHSKLAAVYEKEKMYAEAVSCLESELELVKDDSQKEKITSNIVRVKNLMGKR